MFFSCVYRCDLAVDESPSTWKFRRSACVGHSLSRLLQGGGEGREGEGREGREEGGGEGGRGRGGRGRGGRGRGGTQPISYIPLLVDMRSTHFQAKRTTRAEADKSIPE